MKILVSGFPYVRQSYFDVFNHYPQRGDELAFLLPKTWKVKGGKFVFYPPNDKRVISTNAYFHHSNYPIVGGLLKGWMLAFPFVVFKKKFGSGLDMVYSCSEPILLTTLYQAFWTKLFRIKHVVFSWENINYKDKFKGINGLVKSIILKLNLLFSDGVICGNIKSAAIFESLTDKPVSVIPMSGVDQEFYTPLYNKKFRDKDYEGSIVYLFSGAVGYRKGIHLIIEAFAEVVKETPAAYLIIVGSGEYETDVDRQIEKSGLSSRILRISWVNRDELKNVLSVSDVFLYPSIPYKGWEEQFGYSMAEASLMEKPVISTKSGSIDEVVLNGVSGLLIDPGNVAELRDSMLKLGQNKELREKMGKEGRKYILRNFTHDVVAEKFYKFFHKVDTGTK